jgi:DNA mismatch repair protein MutS
METNPILDEPFSLLWPDPGQKAGQWLPQETQRDLGLKALVNTITTHTEHRQEILKTLTFLPASQTIVRYRQDIFADLAENPELSAALNELLPKIEALEYFNTSLSMIAHQPAIYEVTSRAGELELLIECTERLKQALQSTGNGLRSDGLQRLYQSIRQIDEDEHFQQLKTELPHLLEELRSAASVTIGINLDAQLRPMSATLLSVNQYAFTSSDFLDRLLRVHKKGTAGIAPLYTLQEAQEGRGPFNFGPEPLLAKLFEDLSDVLEKTARPVAQILKRYLSINSRFLAGRRPEFTFYLSALDLIDALKAAGLPVCQPEIASKEERLMELEEAYNLNLALNLLGQSNVGELVQNDVHMNDTGRIFILTGPNQGGKTVYLQMVGLAQVMAQAGLYVPAARACISPVDAIFTHYPVEERLDLGTGRLGDEAQRLKLIFEHATRSSLVLLNESLASTSPGESLYLAQDVVGALRHRGVRAIYTTHLHELAAAAEQINREIAGDSRVVSLVASPSYGEDHARRTYRVIASPPMGRSYAREIAEGYGITYTQLTKAIESSDQSGEES